MVGAGPNKNNNKMEGKKEEKMEGKKVLIFELAHSKLKLRWLVYKAQHSGKPQWV